MKQYVRVAMLVLTMTATSIAVVPQGAAAAPPATTAVVQVAPVAAAPVDLAAPPTVQWSYFCSYTVYSGFGGGVAGTCSLDSVYMNWWVLCYNPFGLFYYYVNTGYFGPYGGWNFWAFCGGDAFPVQYGYDYLAF